MSDRPCFFRILNLVVAVAVIIGETTLTPTLLVVAQTAQPNPLEQPIKDSLLPSRERSLTPFERRRLQDALDRMNDDAMAQLQANDANKAFEIWYRELRLRRVFGRIEEVNALGRVGQIAWQKTRKEDVQFISQRLQTVQQEVEKEGGFNSDLLNAFATAYGKLRDINSSIEINQKILANVPQSNISDREKVLNQLGNLYLAKFDYPNAAKIYEEFLKISQAQGDTDNKEIYLEQLAEIYSQSSQPKKAVTIKEQLLQNYQDSNNSQAIPELKIEIGDDYLALKKPERASQSYQQAFDLAWSLQEYGTASDALNKLGDLYQNYDRTDYALQIYQQLIRVEQQSYNYYDLMNTYDRIGQIYLKQNNYPQALAAFQKGLEIARSLDERQDYFLKQIERVNTQINKQ
jgi:tetratricopeptide (TPR) repeat protein